MNNLKSRIERIERRPGSRLRVLMDMDAAGELAKHPKRPGEVVVILPDDAKEL